MFSSAGLRSIADMHRPAQTGYDSRTSARLISKQRSCLKFSEFCFRFLRAKPAFVDVVRQGKSKTDSLSQSIEGGGEIARGF